MSLTPEQIIHKLASIDIRELNKLEPARKTVTDLHGRSIPPHADTFDLIHDLVLAARTVEAPVQRPARQTETADDYEAVVQLAVVLTRDGRVLCQRRADAPEYALGPLFGALANEVDKMHRATARRMDMKPADFADLVGKMSRAANDADFRRRALKIEPGTGEVIAHNQDPTIG